MGFSMQEYWSGLPFPSPGDLPCSGIEPLSFTSPALAGRFFMASTTWEAFSLVLFRQLTCPKAESKAHCFIYCVIFAFSYSVDFLCTFLMMLFEAQKFLILMKFSWSIFSSVICVLLSPGLQGCMLAFSSCISSKKYMVLMVSGRRPTLDSQLSQKPLLKRLFSPPSLNCLGTLIENQLIIS